MTLAASLLLCVLPQVLPGGDIQLPPPKERPANQAPLVRPLSEIERFRRDLQGLQGPLERVERQLQSMAQDFAAPALESLVIEVLRVARSNEMTHLTVAIQRFLPTSSRVADELLFQLLSRPLGDATRAVLETMAHGKGEAAKAALFDCVRSRVVSVRRPAVEVLLPRLVAADLPTVLQLSREQSLDLQLRAIELLRGVPDVGASRRLIELLSKDPTVAGAACTALIQIGEPAVPPLQELLVQPPIDRGFCYAAFALAEIGRAAPGALPMTAAAPLIGRLAEPELLTRVLAAIPLADLAYRAQAGDTLEFPDVKIVETLLEVVQPRQFLPNLGLVGATVEPRLVRLTGRVRFDSDALSWRDWWQGQRDTFLGVRAAVRLEPATAGRAIVSYRHGDRMIRILAEDLAGVDPIADALEIVLPRERMLELAAALAAGGFHEERRMQVDSALPRQRSLQLQVGNGRAVVTMPQSPHAEFDALVAVVQRCVDDEVWQLFRAKNETDRGAFWRSERQWRDANPAPLARGQRFLRRLVDVWPQLTPTLRARGLDHVLNHAERRQLWSEADGGTAVAMLATQAELAATDLQLLEFAATAPGDSVWRAAVDLAARAKGGGRAAVRAVFGVLGPDAILAALQDERPIVRRAGIDEVVVVRDQRAGPRLIQLLQDPDFDVQRAAIHACGHLQLTAASRAVVDLITTEATLPELRRDALRALGRVGGELAFPVLERAMTSPDMADKEATLRGLGDLRDPRAANLLAELVVVGYGKDLGALARVHLQRQGGSHAVPALRQQLGVVQNQDIRNDLVLLLGAYQEPQVVPDLIDLLRKPGFGPQAAMLLAGTTGLPLVDDIDRIENVETWWRRHKNQPQWQWLLDGLAAAGVTTSLRPESFTGASTLDAVVELTRLLVELAEDRLRALTAGVLRAATGEDFGVVTMQTDRDTREAIAARYRAWAETMRAAKPR
jgi:HEAT repeat protein